MIKTSSKLYRLAFVLFCISLSNSLITAKRVGKKATRTRHPANLKVPRKPGSIPRSNNVLEYDCEHGQASYYLPNLNNQIYSFPIKAREKTESACRISFFGSRIQECTAHIICYDIETKSAKSSKKTNSAKSSKKKNSSKSSKKTNSAKSFDKCTDAYFRITDAMGGEEFGCGNSLTLGKYLKPTKFGHDLYVEFQGTSGQGSCSVFCGEGSPGEIRDAARELTVEAKNERKTTECECGVPKGNQVGSLIVNGEDATPFEFPWMAGLIGNPAHWNWEARTRNKFCGGSLITDRHILTAAHCFFDKITFKKAEPNHILVLLHAHVMDLNPSRDPVDDEWATLPGIDRPLASDEEEKSLRLEVEKIETHPLYLEDGSKYHDFDVAVLVLKQRVDFKIHKDIRPICLYPESDTAADYTEHSNLTLSGWGNVRSGGFAGARTLQKMHMPVISREACNSSLISRGTTLPISQMCAYREEGVTGSCQGDSGGPSFKPRQGVSSNPRHQVGIVSWGYGCAEGPTMYTDVFEVQEWIYHKTRDHGIWCN